jgi:hypothetical protein
MEKRKVKDFEHGKDRSDYIIVAILIFLLGLLLYRVFINSGVV